MSLTKRTEILLDDERYERLRRHAESSGTSIAALIRGAIDRAYPAVSQERRRAAAGFLSAVRREGPAVE
jgi:predicted DNA-binding protein